MNFNVRKKGEEIEENKSQKLHRSNHAPRVNVPSTDTLSLAAEEMLPHRPHLSTSNREVCLVTKP